MINVREDYIEGDVKIGDLIYLIREPKTDKDNFGLEANEAGDPVTELTETVAKMRKELTTLKGQVTRLKNGK